MFQVKIHGLLLSAASPFLSNIFNTTFSPNLEHTVITNPENGAHQKLSAGIGSAINEEQLLRFVVDGFKV